MKVYLVMAWDYEQSGPMSIWSTKDSAEAEANRLKDGRPQGDGPDYDVEEFEVDPEMGLK